ncbi:hypothetical protein [Actinoplanes sp. DH11]|uniref:hypothetical protein n=1 Tax=Actinoplanes sp. DH11 TaxID=2857011 RepID=UPI001E41842A|nr:hypothetical protein [Actinoplanes sp. DH11]
MRALTILLFAVAALAPLAACGSEPPTSATPSGSTPAAEAGTPAPPGPGELPGGLPHGDRTLTGVVEQAGGCTLLLVGERRWSLTGTPAETLTAGARVTVTGQVTTAAADCAGPDVVRALVVRRVTPG